jgi:hypothetical protein
VPQALPCSAPWQGFHQPAGLDVGLRCAPPSAGGWPLPGGLAAGRGLRHHLLWLLPRLTMPPSRLRATTAKAARSLSPAPAAAPVSPAAPWPAITVATPRLASTPVCTGSAPDPTGRSAHQPAGVPPEARPAPAGSRPPRYPDAAAHHIVAVSRDLHGRQSLAWPGRSFLLAEDLFGFTIPGELRPGSTTIRLAEPVAPPLPPAPRFPHRAPPWPSHAARRPQGSGRVRDAGP